jgi:transcription antitermination factor NusG
MAALERRLNYDGRSEQSQKADVTQMGEACLQYLGHTLSSSDSLESTTPPVEATSWYALKVHARAEAAVVKALQNRGFSPYCPMRRESRRYSDRIKVVETALFSGYVFCQFDAKRKLPLITCPGVEHIVGTPEGPTSIPFQQLLDVKRMIDAGALAVHGLECGQSVRVISGVLQGIEGTLIRETSGDRLVVSIELLNQGAALYVSSEDLSAAR